MSEPIGLRDNDWRNAHRYTGHGAALHPDEEFVRAVHYDEAVRHADLAAERDRKAVELLRVARCPDSVNVTHEMAPCQWCDERNATLAAYDERNRESDHD